jgi:hypothetical protein
MLGRFRQRQRAHLIEKYFETLLLREDDGTWIGLTSEYFCAAVSNRLRLNCSFPSWFRVSAFDKQSDNGGKAIVEARRTAAKGMQRSLEQTRSQKSGQTDGRFFLSWLRLTKVSKVSKVCQLRTT